MTKKYSTAPFYLFLIPFFFILQTYQENLGLISVKTAGLYLARYLLMSVFVYAVIYVFSNPVKTKIITALFMLFFFFFTGLHQLLKIYSPIPFFGTYTFVLPFSILLVFLAYFYVQRSARRFERFSVSLNVLFTVYIILDLALILYKSSAPEKQHLSVNQFPEYEQAATCDTCVKPDIYFLLFDGYAGSQSLKEKYRFDNDIDEYLIGKGFEIQTESHSNYNYTGFSLSSILNMSYIKNFKNPKAATARDYVACEALIKNNRVTAYLRRSGYDILNFSIFDLQNQPALVEQYFSPESEELITDKTFFDRVNDDIGWHFYTRLNLPVNQNNPFLKHIKNNALFISHLKTASAKKTKAPRFIYTHLLLPHSPFFFDPNGNPRDRNVIFTEKDYNTPSSYLQYVQYTNRILKDLIDTIVENNPKAVIVLMGDHGYRLESTEILPRHHFSILNAVYYPDKDYRLLYDEVSGCNQFRVVLNKLFHQNFPLLKDSSVYIIDKK